LTIASIYFVQAARERREQRIASKKEALLGAAEEKK
jgi:hypothetical protein